MIPAAAFVQYPTLNLEVLVQLANQLWLIYDALIVRCIFSTVRCNALAEIDSVAIATATSNRGGQYQHSAVGIDPIIIISLTDCNLQHASSKKKTLKCPKCAEEISLDECFKDKAAEKELKTTTIMCTNRGCSWEGLGQFFMVS